MFSPVKNLVVGALVFKTFNNVKFTGVLRREISRTHPLSAKLTVPPGCS